MGKSTINGNFQYFSIAMLNYQRVKTPSLFGAFDIFLIARTHWFLDFLLTFGASTWQSCSIYQTCALCGPWVMTLPSLFNPSCLSLLNRPQAVQQRSWQSADWRRLEWCCLQVIELGSLVAAPHWMSMIVMHHIDISHNIWDILDWCLCIPFRCFGSMGIRPWVYWAAQGPIEKALALALVDFVCSVLCMAFL